MYDIRAGICAIRDAVVPPRCASCGDAATAVCPGCARSLELLPQPPPVAVGSVQVLAAFLYSSPLREILHVGKYRDGRSALRVVALLAAERFSSLPAPTVLVPVPLGRARRRARGYNQADTIAAVIADVVGAPLRPWLQRRRETGSQVGRSPAGRAANLASAFGWVGPPEVAGTVWVVDDVITTGATMMAALDAVPTAGVGLRGLAVARAGEHFRLGPRTPPPRHRGIMGT